MKTSQLFFYFVWSLMTISSTVIAQVKIGDNPGTIDASAVLELESTNKGFLPTRIALSGSTDITTIPSPANGLLVFNTATISDITPGIYYFYNGFWKRVEVSSGGSGANASSQTVAFVGSYVDQMANGVKIGNYSFRIIRRPGNTTYTSSSELCDSHIKYSGPNANEDITGYASTMWGNAQFDYSGEGIAAPSTSPTGISRNNNTLNKNTWYAFGEPGFATLPSSIEKRQYIITPADPNNKSFYRVEFALIDPTNACGTCNASNPSENDAKVIIFIEYLSAN